MFHHTPAHTHKQQTILCCNCCIPKCRCFCPLLKVTYITIEYIFYIMGSISHPVLFIFGYIFAYKYALRTKKLVLYQQLFCWCIKTYLIAVFRKITHFFTLGFPFPLFFTCQQKLLFVIKNIKIQLMLNCSSTATSSPMFFFI